MPKNKKEQLLLLITENNHTLIKQTTTKNRETLGTELTKPMDRFLYDIPKFCMQLIEIRWITKSRRPMDVKVTKQLFEIETRIWIKKLYLRTATFFFQRFKNWWWTFRATRSKWWHNKTSCYWKIKGNGFSWQKYKEKKMTSNGDDTAYYN